jgi:large subunit ribosomal protein L4
MTSAPSYLTAAASNNAIPEHIAPQNVTTTVFSFPKMEPLHFTSYPSKHLYLPLRRDILQRAVVYEGSNTRQGTASTKWRREVHGSTKKLYPQKGTGRARVGDKKSPIRRGGGVAFGPKPRDFGIDLPKRVYDLAWRTALSYRYRRGQLIVIEDNIDEQYRFSLLNTSTLHRYLGDAFEANGWGYSEGRSTLILSEPHERLEEAMSKIGHHGRVLRRDDVDVKDLLTTGRLIIEQSALNRILKDHQTDLTKTYRLTRPVVSSRVEEEWEDEEILAANASEGQQTTPSRV